MEGEEPNSVYITYFLNWMNHVEHPHLIQVDRHSHQDIRLRNVKRWLLDYRGKEFPESFAWSCKRQYKMGYVWQDLMDDDIITPISDHEYVLQGSLISTTPWDYLTLGEATVQDREADPFNKLFESKKDTSRLLASQASNVDSIPTQGKKHYQIRNNPLTAKTKNIHPEVPHTKSAQPRSAASVTSKQDKRYYTTTAGSEIEEITDEMKNRFSQIMNNEIVGIDEWFMTSPSPVYSPPKRGASSNMLLGLLNCGVVETDDSAMKLINKNSSDTAPRRRQRQPHDNGHWGIYCYEEFSSDKKRSVTAAPLREPNCSQCGKCFKPEKLHKHMKACRGIKVNATAASVAERMTLQKQ